MTTKAIRQCLEAIIRRSALEPIAKEFSIGEFTVLFSSLGWRLRHSEHRLAADEYSVLKDAGLVKPELLSTVDIARMHLLAEALLLLPEAEHSDFFDKVFRTGDNKEREILLKSLMLLPTPLRFIATATDACRAAVKSTFEAISCENVYPSEYFQPETFRAMVLKALHLGIPVQRIYGLDKRRDADLARMAADYAKELKAAGHQIPEDVLLIGEIEGRQ